MACVCDHDYPRRPCHCSSNCGRPCPTPRRMKALEAELKQSRHPLGQDSYGCQRCGRVDGLDAIAPNEVWAALTDGRIAGPSGEVVDGRWQVLCLWCMDELAAEKGLTSSVSLHFAGRTIHGTSQSDADQAHIRQLAEENHRLRAMLLHIHSVVDGGWPRLDVPTREYWLLQADNPEWAEWFGNQEP